MGWRPTALNMWIDHNNEVWRLDLDAPLAPLRRALSARLFQLTWVKAAEHRNGRGLEDGPDLHAARGLYLSTHRRAPALANQMLRIWAGGWWDEQRTSERYGGSSVCRRCQAETGEPFHHVWHCMSNDATEKVFGDTCHIAVPRNCTTNQCFWARALLPRGIVEIPPPQETPAVTIYGSPPGSGPNDSADIGNSVGGVGGASTLLAAGDYLLAADASRGICRQ